MQYHLNTHEQEFKQVKCSECWKYHTLKIRITNHIKGVNFVILFGNSALIVVDFVVLHLA